MKVPPTGEVDLPARPAVYRAAPPRWVWLLPRVAAILVVISVAGLLWLLHRSEREEQRASLISDLLWVEQNLRFQLSRDQDSLRQLVEAANLPPHSLEQQDSRMRLLLAQKSGLVRIALVDMEGRIRYSHPPIARVDDPTGLDSMDVTKAAHEAQRLAQPIYRMLRRHPDGDSSFQVHIPVFSSGRYIGGAIGMYSGKELLAQFVPWWFAQRYQVALVNMDGEILARKSNLADNPSDLSYSLPFDPPGLGLLLKATAYRSETRLLPALLVTVIVLLSVTIVWSLRSLRRHMSRSLRAEEALREQHAFRKAMEDSLHTGMRARDLAGRITYVNPAFCEMVGFSADELIGRGPPMPYWAPEEIEDTQALHAQVLRGEAPAEGFEIRLMRKNGERFDALIYEAPLIDSAGRHTGWMGSVLDVTERKRAEEFNRQQQERLQATARLVTMGELASSLAHELNQPLSAIASYNTGCLNKLESGEFTPSELMDALAKLGRQAQRAGQILHRMHGFVRRSEPKMQICKVSEIIDDAVLLSEPEARRRHIRIEANLPDALPPIQADPVMIEQVLLNLIRNGMDAMAAMPPAARKLHITACISEGMIQVSVADEGAGISPDIAARLYAPFFTTKAEGMGMGLNICRSIVELHRGRLWFETNPGGGTLFHFSLPMET